MKSEIRKNLKSKRHMFGGIEREKADKAILDNFISAYFAFDSFFIYKSASAEARTDLIIEKLLSAGKRVYLPRVECKNIVAVPYFGERLQKGAFGIEEPSGEAYYGDIDVTVIPLLAVNSRGFRIGYGGGFYDRYLKGKTTRKVGLGYAFQFEDFKEDDFDEPLDIFLSEGGMTAFASNQR